MAWLEGQSSAESNLKNNFQEWTLGVEMEINFKIW